MARKIALSNLSVLPTSIIDGPKATWELAQETGFDALKINPLRGWSADKVLRAKIPVTAFEAPWRNSFLQTLRWALKGEIIALAIDPILFGYKGALEKAADYRMRLPPETICVDPTAVFLLLQEQGRCIPEGTSWAKETDQSKRWITEICPDPRCHTKKTPVVLDTWHLRGWVGKKEVKWRLPKSDDAVGVTQSIMEYPSTEVVAIDVQTRDVNEWLAFLQGKACTLSKQLAVLRELPQDVSAALEISPGQLNRLARKLNLSRESVLDLLNIGITEALCFG